MTTAALQLDVLRPPASRARWVGWLLLAAAVPAVVLTAEAYSQAEQAWALAQGRHQQLQARSQADRPQRSVTPPDAATLAAIRRANAVIEQLAVPWGELFEAIEAADARGLGVLSLTPSARDRSLRLAGEARSMSELLAYVQRMAAQPALQQVHLLGYGTAVRDGVPVVTFTLAATWRPR
ncbi:MAG: hypothetical protein K2Q07_03415 [Burkholderiaceae bacterium]|nr:hypothetical protein [Burkholderiaceae bacterium]